MSQNQMRKKIPETCRYWKEGRCQKGDYQCTFVHGIVCPNDGRCWKENCNKIHMERKSIPQRDYYARGPMNYHKPGPRPRYRRSRSRSQSPVRYRKMPQRGRSPFRRRSRSRSPAYQNRVYSPYQRRSRSPSPMRSIRSRSRSSSLLRTIRRSRSKSLSPLRGLQRSRSRSLSPLRGGRRSVSPHHRRIRSRSPSGSWQRSRSRSASRPRSRKGRVMSTKESPIRSRSKTRGLSKLLSRSPSPRQKRRSSSSSNSSSRSSSSGKRRPRSRAASRGRIQNSSPSSLKNKNLTPVQGKSKTPSPETKDSDKMTPQGINSNTGRRMQLNLENICDNLECETEQNSVTPETVDKDAAEKEAISRLQAQIAKDFMNPETQKLMEQVLSLTKQNATKSQPEESKSKKDFFLDEVGDDIELDLEEVGEEVDDIFAKSLNRSLDESNEDDFDKGFSINRKIGLKAGSNPSPPRSKPISKPERSCDFHYEDFRSDWDLKAALETTSESMKKSPQMPPPNQQADGSKTGNTLWTPALIRNQTQAPKNRVSYLPKENDWEMETPYVGRKDKSEMQRPAAPSKTVINEQQPHGASPAVPFALPEAEPLSTHRNLHKLNEMTQDKNERTSYPKGTLFPSAQAVVSSIPTVSHAFSQASVTLTGQSSHTTDTIPSCTANFIRDATKEESYSSPKERPTAPKKVPNVTPRKPSESPKRSNHKRRKEKKSKRKKDSSEDDSDSVESDDSEENKKLTQEKEKDTDELEVLLFKKESLIKRVKLLMEQKAMMSSQREDMIKNHKGSKTSLSNILDENSFLIKEIGKQIGNIYGIVKNINHEIEVKRSHLKQPTSVSKGRSESPHVSREMYEATRYSAERERVTKKMIKPIERSDGYQTSPYQEKKTKSPYRKNNRSPSPLHHLKQIPSEVERKSLNKDSCDVSPKGFRRKRSESPSPSMPKVEPKPSSSEKQIASPPRKRLVKSSIEISKKPAGPQAMQYQAPKNTNSIHYAPHETQRAYIRYMDQGMHWCKLCSLFCETAPEYVDHLMTESHLGRVKNDRKSWLCKPTKEEKEPKPPNAHMITVPIQGIEFLHSLPSYYCSLCDTFMRDKGEALRHPESKLHVSKYKIHRAQNPLFESTFLKAKTAAYAKYKIDEERKKMENEISSKEKALSVENKLLKQIKGKIEKEIKDERLPDSQDDSGKNFGSIRVASRGSKQPSDKKPSTSQSPNNSGEKYSSGDSTPNITDGSKGSETVCHAVDELQTPQKSGPKEREKDGDYIENIVCHDRTSIEDKGESKQKEGSKDADTDRKPVTSKLPLIGKMPFLKKKPGVTKGKEQQSTPIEEAPKEKKESAEKFSLLKKIPLPCWETEDSDAGKALQQIEEMKEMPLTVRPVAAPVECPVTHASSEDKIMAKKTSDAENTKKVEEKDSHGSELYDPLEAGNEDSSDDVATATIEALDLLNIPLPGFSTVHDSQKSSKISVLSDTEDKYQPEDMEIESTPLLMEEDRREEGNILADNSCALKTMYPSSGMIMHPDIPPPPMVVAPPLPVNLNNPPPLNLNTPPPINLNTPPSINLNNPPPMNLNNPPLPPINLSAPPPINVSNPPSISLNNPPPTLNLNTPLPPISLNNPPPPISMNNPPLPSVSLNEPPPPGTEESDFSQRGNINTNVSAGNILPVLGSQKFISQCTPPPVDIYRKDNPEALAPPGTEEEYSRKDTSSVLYSVGICKNKAHVSDAKSHLSKLCSTKGKKVIKGSSEPTTASSATQDDREELTPPPPGTEGSLSGTDSCVKNESNSLSVSDLEAVPSELPLASSDLEVLENKEELCSSKQSKSKSNVSETGKPLPSLPSNIDQFSHAKTQVSESVQQHGKNSGECLTTDAKLKELIPSHTSEIKSPLPSPEQRDKGSITTSHSSTGESSCTPFKKPDKGIVSTPHISTEESSCTPLEDTKEPDKGTITTSDNSTGESSCTSFKEPDDKSTPTLLSIEESSSTLVTLPDKGITTSFSSTKESSCTSFRPDIESLTTLHKSPGEMSCTPLKEPDEKSITASNSSTKESSCALLKGADEERITPSHSSTEESSCTPVKVPDEESMATSHSSTEEGPCTLFKEPDEEKITPSHSSTEESSCAPFKGPDEEKITPSHSSTEEGPCTSFKGLDEERITPSHSSTEESSCTPFKGPDEKSMATSHSSTEKGPCTPFEVPEEESKTTLHSSKEESSDTHFKAPEKRSITASHENIEEIYCMFSSKELDIENLASLRSENVKNFSALPSKEPHMKTAISCDSCDRPSMPSTKEPEEDIATSQEKQEWSSRPLDQHSTVTKLTSSQGILSESYTLSPKRPDTITMASSCESEEWPRTSLTEQPDIGNVSVCESKEHSHTLLTEQQNTYESTEDLHTTLIEQPNKGDIASKYESEEWLHTQPGTGTTHSGCASEGNSNMPLTKQPDTGDISTSPSCNVDKSYTHPPENIATLQTKQSVAGSTNTSYEKDKENVCILPREVDEGNIVILHEEIKTEASSHENNKNFSSLTEDKGKKQEVKCEFQKSIEDRSWTLPCERHDTRIIPSSSKLPVSQNTEERLLSKESRDNEQDSNRFSTLKNVTEDSYECCDPVNERDLSMDITNLYVPSTSDSVYVQSMTPNKLINPQTEEKDTFVTVENIGVHQEKPEIIQENKDFIEGVKSESVKKSLDSGEKVHEARDLQGILDVENKEPLVQERQTSAVEFSDSCKDSDYKEITDSETVTFSHECPVEGECTKIIKKVQKQTCNIDGAFKETEEVTADKSIALTDSTLSSEDEVVTSVGSIKRGKRQQRNTRKNARKKKAHSEWLEGDECTPPRYTASRSSASHQTVKVVESPRPLRSSRRAAAAAIKAMANNQDDTPPDSPPSDVDSDYSD